MFLSLVNNFKTGLGSWNFLPSFHKFESLKQAPFLEACIWYFSWRTKYNRPAYKASKGPPKPIGPQSERSSL